MIAEQLQDGRRQIQFGNTENSELIPGESFKTAKLYICHSNNGMGGLGSIFRDFVANRIVDFPHDSIRPVHYNCWEAVYFNHNIDELKEDHKERHEREMQSVKSKFQAKLDLERQRMAQSNNQLLEESGDIDHQVRLFSQSLLQNKIEDEKFKLE